MISSQVREHICLIARTSPADWKISAFSTWSLTKLAEHLVKQNVVPAVSRETLRLRFSICLSSRPISASPTNSGGGSRSTYGSQGTACRPAPRSARSAGWART